MILFKQEHKPMILGGRKTQTRRTGKKRWNVGSIHQAKTGFKKDDVFASLRILAVRPERLGDISEADARAEGYDSIEEYKKVFARIYGRWMADEDVWVVDFEKVDKEKAP